MKGTAGKKLNLALNVTDHRMLDLLRRRGLRVLVAALRHQDADLSRLLDSLKLERVYLGAEFCWHRMPGARTLLKYADAVIDNGLALAFQTPVVYMESFGLMEKLLAGIERLARRKGKKIEVVVNDWGLLWLVRERFGRLEPVLGRVLFKIKKDPRFVLSRDKNFSKVLGSLRRSSASASIYRKFLSSWGIRRVECDLPEQGLNMDFRKAGLEASVHLPYTYVTSGRRCLASAMAAPLWEKGLLVRDCRQECRTQGYVMSCTRSSGYLFRGDEGFSRIKRPEAFLVGKAVLTRSAAADPAGVSTLSRYGFSRVVWTAGAAH